MNILHLKSLAVNIIVATKFILYVKKKEKKRKLGGFVEYVVRLSV